MSYIALISRRHEVSTEKLATSHGLVAITGCAHPGIVNIVRKAKEMFKDEVYLSRIDCVVNLPIFSTCLKAMEKLQCSPALRELPECKKDLPGPSLAGYPDEGIMKEEENGSNT